LPRNLDGNPDSIEAYSDMALDPHGSGITCDPRHVPWHMNKASERFTSNFRFLPISKRRINGQKHVTFAARDGACATLSVDTLAGFSKPPTRFASTEFFANRRTRRTTGSSFNPDLASPCLGQLTYESCVASGLIDAGVIFVEVANG
jgi:hypothetical protein